MQTCLFLTQDGDEEKDPVPELALVLFNNILARNASSQPQPNAAVSVSPPPSSSNNNNGMMIDQSTIAGSSSSRRRRREEDGGELTEEKQRQQQRRRRRFAPGTLAYDNRMEQQNKANSERHEYYIKLSRQYPRWGQHGYEQLYELARTFIYNMKNVTPTRTREPTLVHPVRWVESALMETAIANYQRDVVVLQFVAKTLSTQMRMRLTEMQGWTKNSRMLNLRFPDILSAGHLVSDLFAELVKFSLNVAFLNTSSQTRVDEKQRSLSTHKENIFRLFQTRIKSVSMD